MTYKPKTPLFSGRNVRESRRAKAIFMKDWPKEATSHLVVNMSQRRIKKAWAKYHAGFTGHLGNKERKLVTYYTDQVFMDELDSWDPPMLSPMPANLFLI